MLGAVPELKPPVLVAIVPGTDPVPGAPILGKTVPSCRLPRFGWAAVGADALAVVVPPLLAD